MEIVNAFNALNNVDRSMGMIAVGVFAVRYAVVPFVRACRGKNG